MRAKPQTRPSHPRRPASSVHGQGSGERRKRSVAGIRHWWAGDMGAQPKRPRWGKAWPRLVTSSAHARRRCDELPSCCWLLQRRHGDTAICRNWLPMCASPASPCAAACVGHMLRKPSTPAVPWFKSWRTGTDNGVQASAAGGVCRSGNLLLHLRGHRVSHGRLFKNGFVVRELQPQSPLCCICFFLTFCMWIDELDKRSPHAS
jgi:hypothetical protein